MVSGDSERIFRLRRRYNHLAAGVDEDRNTIHDIIDSIYPRYTAIVATESEIKELKEDIRKRRTLMQSRIDEIGAIRDELCRVTGET